jgi:uncharacterized protein YrrD
MIKAQSVIGKPVLSRADGQKLESVKDIVIGKDHTHVIALLIHEGGLFSKPTVVPFANVVSFGKDAVVITESNAATRPDHVPEVAQALEMNEKLGGKAIFSETGEQHGKLADIYFDDKTGSITGVDVTDLGPGSASKSVAFLDISDIISFGADAVVISVDAVTKLQAAIAPQHAGAPQAPASEETAPTSAPPIEPPAPATTDADTARVAADQASPAPAAAPDAPAAENAQSTDNTGK